MAARSSTATDVDDRLGEEPGDGSGADVMNLQGIEQRLERWRSVSKEPAMRSHTRRALLPWA